MDEVHGSEDQRGAEQGLAWNVGVQQEWRSVLGLDWLGQR